MLAIPKPMRSSAGLAPRRALRVRDRRGGFRQQQTPALREETARLGQPHVAVVPQRQRPANLAFHLLDALAQRRLRHVQALGGLAEVQRPGQFNQGGEVIE